MRKATLVLALALLAGAPLWADFDPSVGRGIDPAKVYQTGDIDSLDLQTGTVSWVIPIGSRYPVSERLSYGLTLVGNSRPWDFTPSAQPTVVPNRLSNAGVGWSVHLGLLLGPGDPVGHPTPYRYIDEVGGQHDLFAGKLHPDDCEDPPTCSDQSGAFFSRDNAYLRLKEISATVREIEFPDGTTKKFEHQTGRPTYEFRLTEIRDRFGSPGNPQNYVRVAYADSCPSPSWTITDARGRSHVVHFACRQYDNVPDKRIVDYIQLSAFPGTAGTWAFGYRDGGAHTIHRFCSAGWDPVQTLVVPVLESVTRPDATKWSFAHYDDDPTPGPLGQSCKQTILQEVTFPTGGKIQYDYSNASLPGNDPCATEGYLITTVNLLMTRTFVDPAVHNPDPPAATWQYSYDFSRAPDPPPGFCNGHPAEVPPEEMTVTVRAPIGDKTEHFFSIWPGREGSLAGFEREDWGLPFTRLQPAVNGRYLSSRTFDCDTGGANCDLKRSEYVLYERDTSPAGGSPDTRIQTNRRLKAKRTVFHDDGDTFADSESADFSGVGNYRQEVLDGSFWHGDSQWNDQTTVTTFDSARGTYPGGFVPVPASDPWVLGTYTETRTTGGYDGDTAKKTFVFDPSTGFLQSVRTFLAGTTADSRDLYALYCPDAKGNAANELYYGGDGDRHVLPDPLPDCSAGPPATGWQYRIDHTFSSGTRATSQYNGSPFKILDQTIDPGTGLVWKSRDTAGVETVLEYDGMGRLLRMIPQAFGSLPREARTEYVYSPQSATRPWVEIHRCPASSSCTGAPGGNDLSYGYIEFTGFGRVWHEVRLMPDVPGTANDYAVRVTRYNSMGWKERESSWVYDDNSAFGDETTLPATVYAGYDPFGRPATVTLPDGKITTHGYMGTQWVKTDQDLALTIGGAEECARRWEGYDRLGRLYRVEEAYTSCTDPEPTPTMVTEYSYDEASRLSIVCQNWDGSQCLQTRFFAYDNRGFLTSETHPEKGVSGNGSVTYSCYDARGHARYRRDGTSDNTRRLGYAFDATERLTRIRVPDGAEVCGDVNESGTVWKELAYASANSGGEASRGKLASAFRRNLVGAPYPAGTAINVTETYSYLGRQGRPSQRVTQVNVAGVDQEHWAFSQTFDELGNLGSLTYPICTGGLCGTGSVIPSHSVSMTYEDGLLESVTDGSAATWISDVAYHASGLVNQVLHGNNTKDTIAIAANGMARPQSIDVKNASEQVLWQTGTYAYDGGGNIKAMGTDQFRYDKFSRLVEARLPSVAAPTQTYGFDAYGNLTSVTTGSTTDPFPVAGVTNRLQTAFYDPGGNLTAWNANTYSYDLLNSMTRYSTGRETWSYVYTADDERLLALRSDDKVRSWTVRDLGDRVLRRFVRDTSGFVLNQTSNDYVYRGDSLAGTQSFISLGGGPPVAGAFRHFALDHLGTIRLITDSSNPPAVVAQHTYYPFGREATKTSQDVEVMKFTGHERDLLSTASSPADDLDYLHARFRGVITERFNSVDPIGGRPELPQSWNRYSYGIGNPIKYVDPDGMNIWTRGVQVLKVLADKQKRTVLLASFRARSESKVISKAKATLDSVSDKEIKNGVTRVVETQSKGQRDAIASGLSTNGKIRGPETSKGYPVHVNPAEGPYQDVHVQVQGQRRSGSGRAQDLGSVVAGGVGILGEIFAPASSAVSESGDASPGELLSAAAWDVTSTLDPTGLTDILSWTFDLP